MRHDPTTPDTRLADDPMAYNPATVGSLVRLMLGGLPPKHQGEVLQARVRYFDPIRRRPGLPEDVAALVDSLRDDSTSLVLVNLNPSEARTVIVQGGAYGEHSCERVTTEERTYRRFTADRSASTWLPARGAANALDEAIHCAADARSALGPRRLRGWRAGSNSEANDPVACNWTHE